MTRPYGTHLPAISRPAPAHVYRYVGQGDQAPLARNLGASSAITRPRENAFPPARAPQ
jgi:hypothetical protein